MEIKTKELLFKTRKILAKPILKTINLILSRLNSIILNKENTNSIEELLKCFKWKKIAIIWNSPIIENSWYWDKIDSYDIVIRLNKWILNWFLEKKDTWIKTDLWATIALDTTLSPKVITQNIKSKQKVSMIIPYDKNDLKKLVLNILYKNPKSCISNVIFDEISNVLEWKTPSTWFIIIWLFLKYSECLEIWMFWFSFSDFNRINWCRSLTENHNFNLEEIIVNKLIKENSSRLKLFN